MPEATVKEHGDVAFRKEEIGFTLQPVGVHCPTPDARPDKHGPEPSFGGAVPPAPNRAHPSGMGLGYLAKTAIHQLLSEYSFQVLPRLNFGHVIIRQFVAEVAGEKEKPLQLATL